MLLVTVCLFTMAYVPTYAASDSSVSDIIDAASTYFKANATFKDDKNTKIELGLKEKAVKKIISIVPSFNFKKNNCRIDVNKLTYKSMSGKTLTLKADIRVRQYVDLWVGNLKVLDKTATCNVKITLKTSNNNVYIDKTKISKVNLDISWIEHLFTGGTSFIVEEIVKRMDFKTGEDSLLIPLSKILPKKYATLNSVNAKDGILWCNFTVKTQSAIKYLEDKGIKVTK